MQTATLPWLDALSGAITTVAIILFVGVNAMFVIGLLSRRERRFVDRWTRPVIVADAALIATAVGAPVLAFATKLAANGLLGLAAVPVKLFTGK